MTNIRDEIPVQIKRSKNKFIYGLSMEFQMRQILRSTIFVFCLQCCMHRRRGSLTGDTGKCKSTFINSVMMKDNCILNNFQYDEFAKSKIPEHKPKLGYKIVWKTHWRKPTSCKMNVKKSCSKAFTSEKNNP